MVLNTLMVCFSIYSDSVLYHLIGMVKHFFACITNFILNILAFYHFLYGGKEEKCIFSIFYIYIDSAMFQACLGFPSLTYL